MISSEGNINMSLTKIDNELMNKLEGEMSCSEGQG
jgi:hypothetical protein